MKRLVILSLCLTATCLTIHAQQKTGYVNSQQVIQAMPEYKVFSQYIDSIKQADQKVLEHMYGAYQKMQQQIQTESPNKTTQDSVMEGKMEELQDMQQRIQDFEKQCQDDIEQQQQDKFNVVKEKYTKAANELAKAEGYTCVIDLSSDAIIYFNDDAHEITKLVLKKMGITAMPGGSDGPGKGK
jgi:outer membrane protein